MSLHAHVEAQQEVSEVHAQSQAVRESQLLKELAYLERATGLVLIFLDGPHVTTVDKCSQLKNPEELAPVFQVQVKPDVATLVDEAVLSLFTVEATRSQSAHAPSSHAVGTARIEAFLKWQYCAVAIGHCNAKSGMKRQRAALVDVVSNGKVTIELHILRVARAKHLVAVVILTLLPYHVRNAIEQVAGGLGRCPYRVDIILKHCSERCCGPSVSFIKGVAHAHDKVVLVGVTQQRVSDAVEEVYLALGQVHVAHVNQVERVAHLVVALAPNVFPPGTGNDAGVLRALLIVETGHKLGRRLDAALEALAQEWHLKFRECDAHIARVLAVVVVDKAAQVARQTLIGSLELHIQNLRALEDVAVLIVGSNAKSQVTLAVGAL